MTEIRRKVAGDCEIVREFITKTKQTKNVLTEKITRVTVQAIILDCGHKIEKGIFTKVPTNNTRCYECERNT